MVMIPSKPLTGISIVNGRFIAFSRLKCPGFGVRSEFGQSRIYILQSFGRITDLIPITIEEVPAQ